MHFRSLSALLLGALLAACSPFATTQQTPTSATTGPTTAAQSTNTTTAPTAAAQATTVGTSVSYAAGECPFPEPTDVEVECGVVTVPENRTKNNGRTVQLPVAVFESTSASPKADPIIYLDGGPGGNTLEGWSQVVDRAFAPFLAERDIILFDQRGTGYSEPSLDCPEVLEEVYYQLDKNISLDESEARQLDVLTACHKRVVGEGVDTTAYNTLENAADVEAIRQALGYEQWNLYGISYGTRLALSTMREFPEGIRSVVLDSVVPVQSSEVETPRNVNKAFATFFAGCAADQACNAAYPNLETTFYNLVDTLNATPVTTQVQDNESNESYDILLNGDSMIGILTYSLYQTSLIPAMPQIINQANEGDFSIVAQLGYDSATQVRSLSEGMYYSVRCNDDLSFATPEQLAAADEDFPKLRGLYDPSSYTPICNVWQAGKAPEIERQAVSSDLPTLVLAGEYDPATPASDAELAARTLSRSFLFEFPGYGHGVSLDGECPGSITTDFFNDPTNEPDGSCIEEISGPLFDVPEGPLVLTPFENSDAGVRGVVPNTWEEFGQIGHHNRNGDALILQFASGQDRDSLFAQLKTLYKFSTGPTPAGEHQSQRFAWSLYDAEVSNIPSHLALAEDNGRTYVVMLVSSGQDDLYNTLFIPALDALAPL